MKKMLEEAGIRNVLLTKMGRVPPTMEPGTYAIDHAWCTTETFEKIEKCGIVARDEVFISDHLGRCKFLTLFLTSSVTSADPYAFVTSTATSVTS